MGVLMPSRQVLFSCFLMELVPRGTGRYISSKMPATADTATLRTVYSSTDLTPSCPVHTMSYNNYSKSFAEPVVVNGAEIEQCTSIAIYDL